VSVHDADKRDAIYFGRWDGTGRDFLGIKCRVDTHTNLGYGDFSNQTKLEFYTWGNNYAGSREVMCIRGDGNVGIGTANPGSSLDIYSSSTGADVYALRIQTDNASSLSNGGLGPGIGFSQRWWSSGGNPSVIPMAAIHCIKTEVDGTVGGGLAFRTGNNTGGSMVTRMAIDNDGKIGIGPIPGGNHSPGTEFDMYYPTSSRLMVRTDTGQAQILLRAGGVTGVPRACRIDFAREQTGAQYFSIISDYEQAATYDLTVASSTYGRIMTWLKDGKVGIRTTTPNHPLSVFGNDGSVGGSANRTWFQPNSTSALSYSGDTSSGNVGVYAEQYIMSSTGFLAQNGYFFGI
jgi:hypothetical protein